MTKCCSLLQPEPSSKSEFKIEFSDGTTHRLAVEVVNGSTVNRQVRSITED